MGILLRIWIPKIIFFSLVAYVFRSKTDMDGDDKELKSQE